MGHADTRTLNADMDAQDSSSAGPRHDGEGHNHNREGHNRQLIFLL
jgi:hypothetical protein